MRVLHELTVLTGPGTPPLNVPLSASARLAALRAKRAGLGALTLGNSSTSQPSTPTGHNMSLGWAGPPPTTPLPPIPTASSDSDRGKKNNRRSVNLASPIQPSYPFPSSREKDAGETSTPTATAAHGFHRSNPSGATFGHGMRPGDHSRGSSFGSAMDGASNLGPSIFRSAGGGGRGVGMGLGNGSVSTFGGTKNASTSSFGDDGSSGNGGNGGYGHSTNYSISSAGTAFAGGGSRSPRESFGPGLAAIAALSRGEIPNGNGSPSSQYSPQYSDPNSGSPSGKSAYGTPGIQTYPPHDNDEEDVAPLDIQKELEKIRREKADRRVSSASMLSNFSTRSTNTFRGAASRVMDVSPDEVRDDEAAELAGERLLGSVGDGLEGLAAFGKRRGLSNKLGTSGGAGSRPGSSRGAGVTPKPTPSSITASPEPFLRSDSNRLQSNGTQRSSAEMDEDADRTITLPRAPPQPTRDGLLAQWGRQPSDNDTIETFESGIVGSGSDFASRLSAEMDARASNGSTVSSQHHLMMKGPSRVVPELKVEEMSETSGKTPLAFKSKPLPQDSSSGYSRTAPAPHERNGDHGRSDRLVNVGVWNDAPVTPLGGDFDHGAGNPNPGGRVDALDSTSRTQSSMSSATTSNLDVMGTPRQARSPSPSSTSYSHTTITPFNANGAKSTSSGKPSLDIDRSDSPTSVASSAVRQFAPPALSISRATPLSSEASLVMMPDEEDDILASPSAGRDRGNANGKEAFVSRKPQRASEDFAMKMEKEMAAGGMGEFALLQDLTIREKRLKLALFGRGPGSSLTKPGSRRPQSMVTIEKKLPDSPGAESASSRADGASSPELEDMIKRSRRSLNAKALRRRRSTGAMATYGNDWRRSEVDLTLGRLSSPGGKKGSGRRAMELDRSGVNVRDSIVLDLPSEKRGGDPEQEQDGSADSDSSLDLHTPLVSRPFYDLF